MARNIITITENGPIKVEGQVMVYNTMGELVTDESPVFLCRCGASNDKPLCDGQHEAIAFTDCCQMDNSRDEEPESYTPLTITARPNGMLVIRGPMIIIGADGKTKAKRNRAALCRCGLSRNKPFCDMTHKKENFIDDAFTSPEGEVSEQDEREEGEGQVNDQAET